jgi:hypothetical protein
LSEKSPCRDSPFRDIITDIGIGGQCPAFIAYSYVAVSSLPASSGVLLILDHSGELFNPDLYILQI